VIKTKVVPGGAVAVAVAAAAAAQQDQPLGCGPLQLNSLYQSHYY
jgi:hypothetical protein